MWFITCEKWSQLVCTRSRERTTKLCGIYNWDIVPITVNKEEDCFKVIHFDIWGSYIHASFCGVHYIFIILDDHSRTF